MKAKEQSHLDQLAQIRAMMEQSTRFLSLSGLSGVMVGIIALAGSVAVYLVLGGNWNLTSAYHVRYVQGPVLQDPYVRQLLLIAIAMIVLGIGSGYFFTARKAKRQNHELWTSAARRMLVNLFIPLVIGGIFTFVLLLEQYFLLLVPSLLIFYGLALFNGSKFTHDDLRWLGLSQCVLGLTALAFPGYGLLFFAFGFGVLHIIYGMIMYRKYDL